MKDLNGKQAAIRAKFSPVSAKTTASAILTRPNVKKGLIYLKRQREKRTLVTADKVVTELARVAFIDPREFYNEDGSLKDVKDLSDDAAAALKSIEEYIEFEGRGADKKAVGKTKKVQLHDKIRALFKLTEHVDIRDVFPQRMEITGKDGKDLPAAVIYVPDNGRNA